MIKNGFFDIGEVSLRDAGILSPDSRKAGNSRLRDACGGTEARWDAVSFCGLKGRN